MSVRTLRILSERPREIACLTIHSLRVPKHSEQESSFTQEAILLWASFVGVRFGECSDRRKVVKCLEERIGVGIGDVSFETRVGSLVVEPRYIREASVFARYVALKRVKLTQNRNLRYRIDCT